MALNFLNLLMVKIRIPVILLLLVILVTSCKGTGERGEEISEERETMKTAFIGTYTKKEGHVDGKGAGIYSISQNSETGALVMGETVAEIINPSFVKTSPDKKFLYAVSELGPRDAASGFIHSFRINPDNTLVETGKISTEGFAPCYIAEDPSGKFVFVANYVGGVVMMYNKKDDGSLKKIQKITLEDPENSHPHSVTISADNRHVYIADLGRDRIYIFDLNVEEGSLSPNKIPFISLKEGAGPRHFAISPKGKYAYSINELNSTISAFKIVNTGELTGISEISSLPEDYSEKNSAADIHIHPSGKFLYVSNRGHNSIAAFGIDENSGELSLLGFTPTGGEIPRNFAISRNGKFLYVANQNSNNITGFNIDQATGTLKDAGIDLEINTPVCIEFLN